MRFPILRIVFPAFLLAAFLAAHPAAAQRLSVYATLDVTHISKTGTGFPTTDAPSGEQYTSITPIGTGGGISLRVLALPRAELAVDIRGAFRDGINGQDGALFGLKFGAAKPIHRIKPYVEAGAGFLTARTRNVSPPTSAYYKYDRTFASHFAIYEVLGGLDLPIKNHIDVRLIEVGGGSSFSTTPGTGVFAINSGIVVHF